jgi:hypothetical protein
LNREDVEGEKLDKRGVKIFIKYTVFVMLSSSSVALMGKKMRCAPSSALLTKVELVKWQLS